MNNKRKITEGKILSSPFPHTPNSIGSKAESEMHDDFVKAMMSTAKNYACSLITRDPWPRHKPICAAISRTRLDNDEYALEPYAELFDLANSGFFEGSLRESDPVSANIGGFHSSSFEIIYFDFSNRTVVDKRMVGWVDRLSKSWDRGTEQYKYWLDNCMNKKMIVISFPCSYRLALISNFNKHTDTFNPFNENNEFIYSDVLVRKLLGDSEDISSRGDASFRAGILDVELLKARLVDNSETNNVVLEKLGIRRDQLHSVTEEQLIDALNLILEMPDFPSRIANDILKLRPEIRQSLEKVKISAPPWMLCGRDITIRNNALLQVIYPQVTMENHFNFQGCDSVSFNVINPWTSLLINRIRRDFNPKIQIKKFDYGYVTCIEAPYGTLAIIDRNYYSSSDSRNNECMLVRSLDDLYASIPWHKSELKIVYYGDLINKRIHPIKIVFNNNSTVIDGKEIKYDSRKKKLDKTGKRSIKIKYSIHGKNQKLFEILYRAFGESISFDCLIKKLYPNNFNDIATRKKTIALLRQYQSELNNAFKSNRNPLFIKTTPLNHLRLISLK